MKRIFLVTSIISLSALLSAQSAFTKTASVIKEGHGFALSNDGKFAAFSGGNSFEIYDFEKNAVTCKIPGTTDKDMCFSADGKYLYYIDDQSINRINVAQQKKEILEDAFSDKYYNPDIIRSGKANNYIVAGFRGNFYGTAFYDIKKGKWAKYKVDEYSFMWPSDFTFSKDEKYVFGAGTNNTSLKMWETQTGREVWSFKDDRLHNICGIALSEDDKKLYVLDYWTILTLDAKTGKLLESKKNQIPSVCFWGHCAIVPEQNVVYYAIKEPRGYKDTSTVYAVELSSGLIMEEFSLSFPASNMILGLKVSADGTKLALNRVNDIILYSIDRKKLIVPTQVAAKPNPLRDELIDTNILFDEENREYLFLKSDNLYQIRNRHLGEIVGNYEIKGNKITFYAPTKKEHDYIIKSREGTDFTFEGDYTIDTSYETFWYKYQFVSKNGEHFPLTIWSKPGKVYDYDGIKVKKLSEQYIVLDSNMKMRSKPSLSAPTVTMDKEYYFDGWVWKIDACQVIFKNSVKSILGETVTKDTIDGITAPWLLVEEEGKFVWIFGGYGKRIAESEREKYQEIAQKTKFEVLKANGLRKAYLNVGED